MYTPPPPPLPLTRPQSGKASLFSAACEDDPAAADRIAPPDTIDEDTGIEDEYDGYGGLEVIPWPEPVHVAALSLPLKYDE